MTKFSEFISWVLHPLLTPLYLIIIIFNTEPLFSLTPVSSRWFIYVISLFFGVSLPLLGFMLLKKGKYIKGYKVLRKDETILGILVTVISLFAGSYLIGKFDLSTLAQQLYLTFIILLSFCSIITLKWSISISMACMGAACGFLFMLGAHAVMNTRFLFMCGLLLSGLLGATQIYLQKKNPAQIYTGFLLGVSVVVLILS